MPADGFRLRRAAWHWWYADVLQGDVVVYHGESPSYCPLQAACSVTRHGQRPLEFRGATGMEDGQRVEIPLAELLDHDCDYKRRYVDGRFQDLHTHSHEPGRRALTSRILAKAAAAGLDVNEWAIEDLADLVADIPDERPRLGFAGDRRPSPSVHPHMHYPPAN